MFVRHGPGFTDRLLIHDHINRLAQGVHGDTGSIQYFIWQLGYATFPWVALIPAAVLGWLWLYKRNDQPPRPHSHKDIQRQTLILIGIWFLARSRFSAR